MMRSMYAGVSGLRNHQIRMDVIGNNIANVNTVGFKKSRVIFQDAMYQLIKPGSAPQGERGGTNSVSVGLGVGLSSVDHIMTPGSTQTTGKNTDLSIDGNGFFILKDGQETCYTRAGNFDFDKLGNYLTPGNGLKVQGWMADQTQVDPEDKTQWRIDTTGALTNIDLSSYKIINPKMTSYVRFQGNCDSTLTRLIDPPEGAAEHETKLTSKEFYDSLGNMHLEYFQFEKIYEGSSLGVFMESADPNASPPTYQLGAAKPGSVWRVRASADPEVPVPTADAATNESVDYYLLFDENGNLKDVRQQDPLSEPLEQWSDIESLFSTVHTPSTKGSLTLYYDQPEPGSGVTTPQVSSTEGIALDFTNIKQHNATQTAYAEYQDGFPKGDLKEVSIDQTGTIIGSFSNNVSKNLGRVALATFQNPAGLETLGGNLLAVSANSGDPKTCPPGVEDAGALKPGSLEMSNVDLSEEFTDMIVTQRGFQANSRVITTSDEMLQELVNLKR
ncbi:MAG: flagellar hook protein FlgE [Chitinophagales bacterium]